VTELIEDRFWSTVVRVFYKITADYAIFMNERDSVGIDNTVDKIVMLRDGWVAGRLTSIRLSERLFRYNIGVQRA